ncbi:tetratricopeptide repeat protein [Falsirhodobacter sp. alg1]|uniref:tetratricopeptide repeat protein n=1 Tax=Falsirhodobacter sp. alg1 TaxID=1472418 RepID=UPI000ACE29AE|nr:tetratricopeptide repeat protein [Falsirhodobacter sp. alg1]
MLRYLGNMSAQNPFFHVSLAIALGFFASGASAASLDTLYDQLKAANEAEAPKVAAEIEAEWDRSGSAAMDLLLQRGRAALAEGDYETAIAHLTALIDHAPDFPEGWSVRAQAFYQEGLLGPALDDIAHVLTLDPRHYTAVVGLGTILEEVERPEDAIRAYQEALAIHPYLDGIEEAIDRLRVDADGQNI